MFIRSSRNFTASALLSFAEFSRAAEAALEALRQPAMMVCGWIF